MWRGGPKIFSSEKGGLRQKKGWEPPVAPAGVWLYHECSDWPEICPANISAVN